MSDLIAEPSPEKPSPLDQLQGELNQAFPPGGSPPDVAPPGAEGDPVAGELLDEATIRMFLQVPFDFIAARKGAHWKLSAEELAAVVPPAMKVSNKYAPGILKQWADEIALVVVLGLIMMKRVNLDSEKAAEKKPESPGEPPAAG